MWSEWKAKLVDFYGHEAFDEMGCSTRDPSVPCLAKTNSIYASHIGDTQSFVASKRNKGKKKDCVIM